MPRRLPLRGVLEKDNGLTAPRVELKEVIFTFRSLLDHYRPASHYELGKSRAKKQFSITESSRDRGGLHEFRCNMLSNDVEW
jgi:hypothetical protein